MHELNSVYFDADVERMMHCWFQVVYA